MYILDDQLTGLTHYTTTVIGWEVESRHLVGRGDCIYRALRTSSESVLLNRADDIFSPPVRTDLVLVLYSSPPHALSPVKH